MQDQSAPCLSADEKSPCDALPHSPMVLIKLFVLATIPPFYTQLCGPGAENKNLFSKALFLPCNFKNLTRVWLASVGENGLRGQDQA